MNKRFSFLLLTVGVTLVSHSSLAAEMPQFPPSSEEEALGIKPSVAASSAASATVAPPTTIASNSAPTAPPLWLMTKPSNNGPLMNSTPPPRPQCQSFKNLRPLWPAHLCASSRQLKPRRLRTSPTFPCHHRSTRTTSKSPKNPANTTPAPRIEHAPRTAPQHRPRPVALIIEPHTCSPREPGSAPRS